MNKYKKFADKMFSVQITIDYDKDSDDFVFSCHGRDGFSKIIMSEAGITHDFHQSLEKALDIVNEHYIKSHVVEEVDETSTIDNIEKELGPPPSIEELVEAVSPRDDDPVVIRWGILDVQVCVPSNYTDQDVLNFAEETVVAGTVGGWLIRREGDENLGGDPERALCHEREGYVHITLDL